MRRTSLLLVTVCALACGTEQPPTGPEPLSSQLSIGSDDDGPPSEFDEWKTLMLEAPLPDVGCFQATYPVIGWDAVACGTPEEEYLFNVGGGSPGPYAIRNPSGPTFTSVEGTFRTSGLTTTNQFDNGTRTTHGGPKNWFSVQLNTNLYNTSKCSTGLPGCLGFQQFIYENHGNGGGQILIQYWLRDYGTGGCPSGWGHPPAPYNTACVKTNWGPTVNSHTITILDKVKLTGKISTNVFGQPVDVTALITNDQNISVTVAEASTGLNGQWTEADFNVYGHDGGTGAMFANGTSIEVHMFFSGTSHVPGDGWIVLPKAFTGEYNNLYLNPWDSAATLNNYGFVEHNP